MTAPATYFQELSAEFGEGWNRFWFTPASPAPLAKLRIATGLLALAYFFSWTTQLAYLFSEQGVLSPAVVQELLESQNRHRFRPSPLFSIATPGGLMIYQAVVILIASLFTAGVFTRVTSLLTLFAALSFVHRAPLLASPFETVLVMLLLYAAWGPSGAAYSFDAWWAARQGRLLNRPGWLANVALKLLQVHLALFLLLVGCSSLAAAVWWNGTAIWFLEAQTLSRPADLSFLRGGEKLLNAWTHFFVLSNLLFPVLVWKRLLRPLVVAFAALMWLLMIPITGQLLYVLAVLAAMYAFVGENRLPAPNRLTGEG
jgi:hypothetical protein